MRRLAALLVVLAGVTLPGPAPALAGGGPQKKKVEIGDNYFAPAKLTVNRGSTITWVWPNTGLDVHDVKLSKGPAGVKKFQSEPSAGGYRFKRRLTKPGLYKIVCTLHEEMTMTIRVRH